MISVAHPVACFGDGAPFGKSHSKNCAAIFPCVLLELRPTRHSAAFEVLPNRRLADTDQVAKRGFDQAPVLPVVIPQHVQIQELSLERLVLFRIILGWEMLDNVTAAIAEELELLSGLAVGTGEFKQGDVQVAA